VIKTRKGIEIAEDLDHEIKTGRRDLGLKRKSAADQKRGSVSAVVVHHQKSRGDDDLPFIGISLLLDLSISHQCNIKPCKVSNSFQLNFTNTWF
jgi:hypothetical protein